MTSCLAFALITHPSQAARYFRLARLMICSDFCGGNSQLICMQLELSEEIHRHLDKNRSNTNGFADLARVAH
eukprot:5687103-Pyramimonas_sp.AAC.1